MVDKFIGDALMALWNAIDAQDDHALRAVRATTAIAAAVRRDNATREVPVRMRIGLHSGPVVVGNIGSRSRMNYTVVGDTVNAAPAPRGARQGAAAAAGHRRDPERDDGRRAACGPAGAPRSSAAIGCVAATSRSTCSRSWSERCTRRSPWSGWGVTAAA